MSLRTGGDGLPPTPEPACSPFRAIDERASVKAGADLRRASLPSLTSSGALADDLAQ